jgi:hypothetical protein
MFRPANRPKESKHVSSSPAITTWLLSYQRSWLKPDAVSGGAAGR